MADTIDIHNEAEIQRLLNKLLQMSVENQSDILNATIAPRSSHGPLSTVEAFRIAAPTALMIDRLVTPVWYLIGIIGNPITMKIWLSKRMRETNSSAIYIGSIAIVHFIFIWLHLLMELHYAWGVQTYNYPVFCEVFNFLYITPQYLAPLLILGFTTERYIAVCIPFRKEKFCTVQRACIVVGCLTGLAFLLGSVQTYIWTFNKDKQMCYYRPGAKEFYTIWTWISELLIFALVPLAVLVFNILVIREIRILTNRASFRMYIENSRQSVNHTSTVTLLSVSFYLICTLLPATIVYSLQSLIPTGDHNMSIEDWAKDPQWNKYLTYYTVRKIVEEICFSNYACYVFIYYITGTYFRSEVHKILFCKWCKSKPKTPVKKPRSQNDQYTLVTSNGKATDHESCLSSTAM